MDLAQLLVQEGLTSFEVAISARDEALAKSRALVSLLVDREVVAEDVLADLLARAAGTIVMDVELGTLDSESVALLGEDLARRHLAIVVAPHSGDALRVAFADPLDQAARAAVRDATGLDVEPVVGTVSGLRAAIDREYGARATGDGERGDFAVETTRQVSTEPDPKQGTTPSFRVDEDATVEQRHEALLLALIEAGVITRADYARALRRLLGR